MMKQSPAHGLVDLALPDSPLFFFFFFFLSVTDTVRDIAYRT